MLVLPSASTWVSGTAVASVALVAASGVMLQTQLMTLGSTEIESEKDINHT